MSEAVATLLRLYLQTLALSLLFVGTGQFLQRSLFSASVGEGSALRCARGYFLGISAFLAAYLLVSRAVGATAALWIAIVTMAALTVREAILAGGVAALRAGWQAPAAALALFAFFSLTNAALWISGLPPDTDPILLNHFGSIHAGRYANYAIFIAEQDRIPFLAQNGGQSILASAHLVLGAGGPLAAVMVWLPASLAFLALLVFGLFRAAGFPAPGSAVAAFMVMFCNVAVSAVHMLVFDNGSPLAFLGYADMAIAVGTFLVFCDWLRGEMAGSLSPTRANLVMAALFGLTWSWYAPQNIVVAAAGCGLAAFAWVRVRGPAGLGRRLVHAGLAFAVAFAIGATQFGSFLPGPLREDTGMWVQEVKPTVRVHPFVQTIRSHWTVPRWKEQEPAGGPYKQLYEEAKPIGNDEVYRALVWVGENQLWDSLRIYGFPILGLFLLALRLRRASPGGADVRLEAWWWLALCTFGLGYVAVFWLELGLMKWWLTRFLVPGSTLALVCLGVAILAGWSRESRVSRRALWLFVVFAATVGPLVELTSVARRNFILTSGFDPIDRRVALLAQTKGPFVFETLRAQPPAAVQTPAGHFLVGGEGRAPGLALQTPRIPLQPGRYRIGFRVQADPSTPLEIEVDVASDGGRQVLARRMLRHEDLARAAKASWAWLDLELPRAVNDAQIRLWNRTGASFFVTDMRRERL